MTQPITPEEIVRTEFPRGTRATGYDEIAVDDFLDTIVTAMRTGRFDPTVIERVYFPKPRGLGRLGYDSAAVDALLDRIAASPASTTYPATNTRANAGKGRSGQQAVPVELTESTGTELPSPYEQPRKGFLARLLGR